MQKALIVSKVLNEIEGLVELNKYLEEGWKVVSSKQMGGAGGSDCFVHFASLVIIEKLNP